MKLDTAITEFMEHTSRDAIQSIDELASEPGLKLTGAKTKGFAMMEAFDTFTKYLNGYAQYKIKYMNDNRASGQDAIREQTTKFLSETVKLEDKEIQYSELPNFVTGYVNGIKALQETVDTLQSKMKEAEVDAESIGDVVEFANQFVEKVESRFNQWFDRVLGESGYKAKQRLFGKKQSSSEEPAPIFL